MRFDDFTKRPVQPQSPLTYTESLQAKLDAQMAVKPAPKFTALEYAMMEGGHSVETENFADGRVKGRSRPGRVKRSGASCDGSVTDLRARAKAASGEKAKMYHWCANMKSGRAK